MGKKYTADTFEGAVTGTASGNVAKTGDTMSGKLNVNYQNAEIEIRNNNPSGSRSKLNFGTLMSTDQASVQLNNSSGDLEFRRGTQSSTPKITVQSTSVYFSDAIRIGANASANELDDYEEGTYNAKFYLGSNSTPYDGYFGFSTFNNSSKYLKVGRKVTLFVDIEYTGVHNAIQLSSSKIGLGNFPFAPTNSDIGGSYVFQFYERSGTSTVPSTYGWNGVITPSFFGTSYPSKASFLKLNYVGTISSWTNGGILGTEFPRSGPFGSNNKLQAVIHYYTNS